MLKSKQIVNCADRIIHLVKEMAKKNGQMS